MTGHWKNYYTDFAVHFVTATVHNWQPVLLSPEIRSIFVEELGRTARRWDVNIIGYVIMPEHFHLLLQSRQAENIMKFIRGMRRSISGKVRKIIEFENNNFEVFCIENGIDLSAFYSKTAGKSIFRLWKERPRVYPISKEDDVIKKLDYIHNNPVRRGLVSSPDEWGYSSFQYYADEDTISSPIDRKHQDVVNSILTYRIGVK